MLSAAVSLSAHAETIELPERSSHFSAGLVGRGLGTSQGGGISITTPYFSERRFALELSGTYMNYATAIDPTKKDSNIKHFWIAALDFIWTTPITSRLRGSWKPLGLGIVPRIPGVVSGIAFTGRASIGLEYFTLQDGWISFFAEGGAAQTFDVKKNQLVPFASGALIVSGIKFYL